MYRRNRRRVLAAASAAAVAATLALTACSSDEPGPDDLADNRVGAMDDYGVGVSFRATEPVSFSILINDHPAYAFDEAWPFWQWLQDKTNVTFEFVPAPLSDFNQVRTTLVTAGDAPDILTRFYGNQETEFVSSGALLAISDYTHLMPNYSHRVQTWQMQPELATHIQADGKYYVLPGMHEEKRFEYGFAVRSDLLAKHNIDTPRTLDEFYDMLVALKQECAGVDGCYPLSDRFNQSPPDRPGGNLIRAVAAGYGVLGGWDYDTVSFNHDTKQYELTAATDGYRKALEYLNKLINEGLLDPESLTQQDDLARQKLAQGKSFVISTNPQTIVNDYRNDIAAIPGAEMALIPVLTGPFGERLLPGGGRLENGVAFPAKVVDNPTFVAMLQFVDWLFYSEEGQEFAKWGVEGETYSKDASGKRTLNADITMLGFNAGAPKHLQRDFGVYNGAFVYGGTADLMHSFYSDEEAEYISAALEGREVLPVPPPAPLNEDEAEELTFIRTPLTDHVMTETLRFILGQRPFSEWSAFVDEVTNQYRGKEYLETINAAKDRFAAGNG
jgi:putative aldouronate transport system substrate-binding protein